MSGGPVEHQGVEPSDPFAVPTGADVSFGVVLHVPEGNTYAGPFQLDLHVGE